MWDAGVHVRERMGPGDGAGDAEFPEDSGEVFELAVIGEGGSAWMDGMMGCGDVYNEMA